MSNVTHSRNASQLADVEVDNVGERLSKAVVESNLAVAMATREVDTTVRQRFLSLEKAIARRGDVEPFVTFDLEGHRAAINTDHVVMVLEREDDGQTAVLLSTGQVQVIDAPYSAIALQVGI